MNAPRMSFVSSIFILLCSLSIASTTATACPMDISTSDGLWSFHASLGSSQSRVVTVHSPSDVTISFTGSDAFTVGPFIPDRGSSGTFTITFRPGAKIFGTFEGVLTVDCFSCKRTANLEGMVPTSGVANTLPNNVSISVSPNPAMDNVNILATGARKAEIGIYDMLGKEFASQKTTDWKLNTASIPPGSYIVRVAGESITGEAFLTSKRVVISR
jgi:hypothetical protein